MTPILIAVPLLCLGALQEPDTLRYAVVLGGNRAGTEVAIREPDGALYDPAAVYRTLGVLPWRAGR